MTKYYYFLRVMQPHFLDLQWAATLLFKYMQQMTSDTFRVWRRVCCFFLSATSNATLVVALSCLIIRECHKNNSTEIDCFQFAGLVLEVLT